MTPETKPTYHFVDLCLVNNGHAHAWVKAPSHTVTTGDLITFQPPTSTSTCPCTGTVEAMETLDEYGGAYHLIAASAPIYDALAVYYKSWIREEAAP